MEGVEWPEVGLIIHLGKPVDKSRLHDNCPCVENWAGDCVSASCNANCWNSARHLIPKL